MEDWKKTIRFGFRPLDGESFSKHWDYYCEKLDIDEGFRPLDGESFSKHAAKANGRRTDDLLVSVP